MTDIARVIWKDEGRDSEGRSFGRAYAENASGEMTRNYGWITWKKAMEMAQAAGAKFDEV